jgi:DNA-binding NtrC family response regulator
MAVKRSKTIYVIDDDMDMGVFLEIALTVAGYLPTVCTEVYPKSLDSIYDVALIDLILANGSNGLHLIESLALRGIPVVCMTGLQADADLVADALAAGACRILHKPFDLPKLRETLSEVLD